MVTRECDDVIPLFQVQDCIKTTEEIFSHGSIYIEVTPVSVSVRMSDLYLTIAYCFKSDWLPSPHCMSYITLKSIEMLTRKCLLTVSVLPVLLPNLL